MSKTLTLMFAGALAFGVAACESPTAETPVEKPATELVTAAWGVECIGCPDGVIICGNPPPPCNGK